MGNKGFTLIETVVVFGILAILSLFGVESIIEFQKNALLEGTADEFASTLREARTKSLAGELRLGEKAEDFTVDGLPKYGVRVAGPNYFLFREYQLLGGPPARADLETFTIEDNLLLTPSPGEIIFDRVTGHSNPITFTLQRKDGGGRREIEAGDKGVTIKRL